MGAGGILSLLGSLQLLVVWTVGAHSRHTV